MPTRRSRFRGAILGHLLGDALGVPVEFSSRASRQRDPVTGMRGYGTHNQPPGTWSDDGSMMLCLLEGLADDKDLRSIANSWVRWMTNAYWTPHGKVFDIGGTTCDSLSRVSPKRDPRSTGAKGENSNGNGSLMRVIPVPLMMANRPHADLIAFAHDQGMVTHAHPRSQIACGIYSDFAYRTLRNNAAEVEVLWDETRAWANEFYSLLHDLELSHFERILTFNGDAWRATPETLIASKGYVIDTLEAALWCLFTTTSWTSCALAAVNLGSDTDTNGAVAGGLAGLVYGDEALPSDWVSQLARLPEIEALIERAATHAIQSG